MSIYHFVEQNPAINFAKKLVRAGYENQPAIEPLGAALTTSGMALATYLLDRKELLKLTHKPGAPETETVVVCFGGGIDSYISTIMALMRFKRVVVMFIDYGVPYNQLEHAVFKALSRAWEGEVANPFTGDFAMFHAEPYKREMFFVDAIQHIVTPDETKGLDWENYIIPARNFFIACMAATQGRRIWISANKRSDWNVGARDKTPRFFSHTSAYLTDVYGQRYDVESPVHDLSKSQAVDWYIGGGGELETLKHTWSCYTPIAIAMTHDDQHYDACGTCYACYKRFVLWQSYNKEIAFYEHPSKGKNWDAFKLREQAKGR